MLILKICNLLTKSKTCQNFDNFFVVCTRLAQKNYFRQGWKGVPVGGQPPPGLRTPGVTVTRGGGRSVGVGV